MVGLPNGASFRLPHFSLKAIPLHKRSYHSHRLQDRIAIVTGSSSGLGRAISLRYAAEGARVVCADLRPGPGKGTEEIKPVHDEINEKGGHSIFVSTDVGSEESVQSLVEKTVQNYGRVDIIVNNAGVAAEAHDPIPIYQSPSERFHDTMRVNSFGVFLGCKYAGIQMMKQDPTSGNRGRIINVASILGLVGKAGVIAYSSAKGSVVNMTKTAALDYAPFGISVNAIAPGFVRTPMIEAAANDPTIKAQIESSQPLKGLGEAEDIAGAALYLASKDSSWVTGICLPVEGGYLAQ